MCEQRLDDGFERPRHAGFVGREATLAELDRLLLDDEADHRVAVTGGPGMGKTAILTAWRARCQAARPTVAHHVLRRDRYGRDDPWAIAGSLAAQIEHRYPAHRDPEAAPEGRLAELLARVSARELAPSGGRLVLVVDGIDEDDVPAERCDPLAEALPEALPRGVRLLCASHSGHPHLDAFDARHGDLVWIDLDHPSAAEDNDATVRAFWLREAPGLGLDDRFVERAVLRAYGNLLHATLLRTHLASVPWGQRSAEKTPRGLPDLLAMLWQRVAGDPLAERGLGILCAAREPLSLHAIGRVAGWSGVAEQRAFAHVARELIVGARREGGVGEYRLVHDSVRAYLVDQLGPSVIRGHHEALARALAAWPPPDGAAARRYALRHALAHRAEAGDWPAIQAAARDVEFLEARCRELGADEVAADVARAAKRCRAAGDTAIGRELGDLAQALARAAPRLREDPTTLAAQLESCLRRRRRRPEELDPHGPAGTGDTEITAVRDAAAPAGPARPPELARDHTLPRAPRRSSRHVILFLAANPRDTGRLLLDEECAAIERELQLAEHGGDFEFRSKWAVTADEMARHLLQLEPTIVHFSGHGGGAAGPAAAASRDVPRDVGEHGGSGIYLQDDQGRSQLVRAHALARMITSSTRSTRVVLLNACYSDRYAEALCSVVECVVGMAGAIQDAAARSFAVGFYRALGYRRSVGNAVEHARATLAAKHDLPDEGVPRYRTRDWVDADQIVL